MKTNTKLWLLFALSVLVLVIVLHTTFLEKTKTVYINQNDSLSTTTPQLQPEAIRRQVIKAYMANLREYDSDQSNVIHPDTGRKVTISGSDFPVCINTGICNLKVTIGNKIFSALTPNTSTTIDFIPYDLKDGIYTLTLSEAVTGLKTESMQTVKVVNLNTETNASVVIATPADTYQDKINSFMNGDRKDGDTIYSIITDNDVIYKTIPVKLANPKDNLEKIRVSAQKAAEQVQTQTFLVVNNFKLIGENAYVELNIDTDGWAGVSYTLSTVRPLIQKTLLKFPAIKHVYFGPTFFSETNSE